MKRLVILIALLSLPLVASGCGNDPAVSAGPAPTAETGTVAEPGATVTAAPDPSATPTLEEGSAEGMRLYELWFTRDDALFVTWRPIPATEGIGRATLEELLAGPTGPEAQAGVVTTIPAETRLLGLNIEHGRATVDLSSEFESGGGSASMFARLAQVVYTLTQFPTVKRVNFMLDGEPVDVFSGEGIVLDHPVGRKDYTDLLPIILVKQPTIGKRITSPAGLWGSANVFEAHLDFIIKKTTAYEIAKDFTTATCGTGCRGEFIAELPFEVSEEQPGTVVVADSDADGDGRPQHEVRVPVTLVPSS